jgi:hypothetical protein
MLPLLVLTALALLPSDAALPSETMAAPESVVGFGSAPTMDDIDFIETEDAGNARARRAIDSFDRESVASAFINDYQSTSNTFYSWSGQLAPQCTPNPANANHEAQVLQRLNYFRAMVCGDDFCVAWLTKFCDCFSRSDFLPFP